MDFLHPYADLDTLAWYAKIAPYLEDFLGKKEIASKIVGEDFVVLKRGTKDAPLYITDFKEADEKFLKLRSGHHLDDAKKGINEKQITLRKYFVPRKLVNFFYATNNEYWEEIDRIFIDIDRQDKNSEEAQQVAANLVKTIRADKEIQQIIQFKILILRTGSSFHILLNLTKKIDHKAYDDYFSYGPKKTKSFISKRADQVSKETWMSVLAGHERKKWVIILDTSNTPPGKLWRCPFSLHIKDAKTIDGITVPLTQEDLEDEKLISKLKSLTPETVWKDIKRYGKIIESSLQ